MLRKLAQTTKFNQSQLDKHDYFKRELTLYLFKGDSSQGRKKQTNMFTGEAGFEREVSMTNNRGV